MERETAVRFFLSVLCLLLLGVMMFSEGLYDRPVYGFKEGNTAWTISR
jgi:hypothetical protein